MPNNYASNQPTLPRIGELFVEAGVLQPKIVSDCLYTARHAQLPVGKVLVSSGYLSVPDIECALETQKLILSGAVTRQSAARLVRRVHAKRISIEEAQALEWIERAFSMPFSQIGKLLLASRILSEQYLLSAAGRSTQEVPLGKLLVMEKAISQALLVTVMNCLIYVRDKKISRFQAAQILKTASEDPAVDLAKALQRHNLEHLVGRQTPRLLDLLGASGLLPEAAAEWALEISVETGRQTGQVLLLYGLVEDTILESALALQPMLATGTLSLARAAELLALCKEMETTLESLLAELDNLNQVVKFLRRGCILDEAKIAELASTMPDFESHCGAILVREGVISHELLLDAMRFMSDIRNGVLTEDQAVEAFKCSSRMATGAEPAIRSSASEFSKPQLKKGQLGRTA